MPSDDTMYNSILLQGAGLLVLILGASAVNLSDYVTPCKTKDPALNECVRQAVQQLFQRSARGITELGVPALDPAKVSKLALDRTGALTMNLTLNNSTHYGLGHVKILTARVDPHKHEYNFSVVIPKYIVSGNYDINGHVILLRITGHGRANISLSGIESEWHFVGEQETRDSEAYLKLTSLVTRIHEDSPKKVELHFDGLFGGNKVLGDAMNNFMNQNWREITKQLKPSVQASFDRRLLTVAQRFLANFPLKELFSDL